MKAVALSALAALTLAAEAAAEEGSVGQTLYQDVCRNCHGPTAKGMASYPKLVGKGADYLIATLMRYRAGEKIGPNSPLMIPHATDLSDDDIASLADYITTTFD